MQKIEYYNDGNLINIKAPKSIEQTLDELSDKDLCIARNVAAHAIEKLRYSKTNKIKPTEETFESDGLVFLWPQGEFERIFLWEDDVVSYFARQNGVF